MNVYHVFIRACRISGLKIGTRDTFGTFDGVGDAEYDEDKENLKHEEEEMAENVAELDGFEGCDFMDISAPFGLFGLFGK